MEILVAVAIILVLLAIGWPVYKVMRQGAHKTVAMEKMKKLNSAFLNYVNQNNGLFPAEDVAGEDSWYNAAKPESKDAWYNALPRLVGAKGVGDYANSPQSFYTDESMLFLPGANYPDKKKIIFPQFAIAFNTKLERTDANGQAQRPKMDQITQPSRTVIFLEQGCLNEDRTLEIQTKKDYDGSPKGSAKSFVGRYGGKGHLSFADGHTELVAVKGQLTETGSFPFPPGEVVWGRTPEENPNKDAAAEAAKKEEKK
jgi:prepilin-type processing-associated H-X9-DG protein